MKNGAYIEKGPQGWQVLQQSNGRADIHLEGAKITAPGEDAAIYARVVDEDSGTPLIPWQKAGNEGYSGWTICLKDIPAGGLYRVETCLSPQGNAAIEWSLRGDMIHHLGIGDVFVIAGQSNAAGYGKDFIYDPPEPGLHLLRNNMRWDMASHPFNESTGTLHDINNEGGNPGHSPYLAFARSLKKALGYPIGLIQTSLGGSPLSAWNPEEDGGLYRNMLDVITATGSGVKGILWYQGCSDTAPLSAAASYFERFQAMVSHLRQDVGSRDLPILTVQLNRHTAPSTKESDEGWSIVREEQRLAAQKIAGVYIVPSTDLGLSDAIHNSAAGNVVLGERLAAAALKSLYGKPFGYTAPDITGAEGSAADTIELRFAPVYDRLYTYEVPPSALPFDITDDSGPLEAAEYSIRGETISLRLNRPLSGGAFVSGLSGQNPRGITPVDNATHCPMLSFNRFPIKVVPKET
jgi:hypothetical protein